MAVLDFERPIVELEEKLEGLRRYAEQEGVDLSDQIARLERELERLREEVFSKLTPWQRVQLARHPDRPYALDYINMMTTDFLELHGDRYFGDDPAVVGGLAKLGGRSVVVVGQQKGRGTKENIARRFGMPNPEGYRKALRLMKLGAKFGLPVISLVDTPGAYPGIDAEERGQP